MSKTIHNPHDKVAKSALSMPDIAQTLFETYLPNELKQQIDFTSLRLAKDSFVDANLREHLSDVLYQVEIAGEIGYLYFLVELQHKPDQLMPFRVLQYSVNIMQQHLRTQKAKKRPAKLPLVYPMIYYSGKYRYSSPVSIYDNFERPELAKQYFMQPIKVIDLSQLSDDELKRHKALSGLEMLQKHIHDRDLSLALERMYQDGVFMRILQKGGEYVDLLLKYAIEVGEVGDVDATLNRLVEMHPEMESNVMTMAEVLRRRGLTEGLEQGKQQGLSEGKLQGLSEGKLQGLSEGKLQGLSEGKKQGQKFGEKHGLEKTARNLLEMGQSIAFIHQATGLSESEIEKLKEQN